MAKKTIISPVYKRVKDQPPFGKHRGGIPPFELCAMCTIYENGGEMEYPGGDVTIGSIIAEQWKRSKAWGSSAIHSLHTQGIVDVEYGKMQTGKQPNLHTYVKVKFVDGQWEKYEPLIVATIEWFQEHPVVKWGEGKKKGPLVGSKEWWAEKDKAAKEKWEAENTATWEAENTAAAAVEPVPEPPAGYQEEAEEAEATVFDFSGLEQVRNQDQLMGYIKLQEGLLESAENEVRRLTRTVDALLDLIGKE